MKWFYVAVEDRVSKENVVVGSMLTISEVKELVGFLEKFNATDFLIIKGEEKL